MMRDVLREYAGFCLVYLDDVIIYSEDPRSHLHHLEQVVAAIARAGLQLKLATCAVWLLVCRHGSADVCFILMHCSIC